MASFIDEHGGCACSRTVCDYGCSTYASKMNSKYGKIECQYKLPCNYCSIIKQPCLKCLEGSKI